MSNAIDQTIFAAARLRALTAQPFLASALFALVPVPSPGLGTFAVDERWRLYIDPAVLLSWGPEISAGALLHEVAHVVRDHAGRARAVGVEARSARRWNFAADAEINDSLLRDGIRLPDRSVTSRALRLPAHRAAEFYFDALVDADLPYLDCGSGAHGHTGLDPAPPHLPAGIDPSERDLLRRMVAIAIRELTGSGPGSVPGEWMRWATATLEPTIPWERLLRSAVRSSVAAVAGRADYTYSRLSRRRLPDIVLPALVQPVPSVAIVLDTSASMDQHALDRAWSEVVGCCRSIGIRRDLLRVYATDVSTTRVRMSGERVALLGGGGTDMRDGLRTAVRARPRPDLVVVMTDGYTPWPTTPLTGRTIACIIRTGYPEPPPRPPSWITTIDVVT